MRIYSLSLWLLVAGIAFSQVLALPAGTEKDRPEIAGQVRACRASSEARISIRPLPDADGRRHPSQPLPTDRQGNFLSELDTPGIYRILVEDGGTEVRSAVVPVTGLVVLPPVEAPACGARPSYPWRDDEATADPEIRSGQVLLTGRLTRVNAPDLPLTAGWLWTDRPVPRVVQTSADGTFELAMPRTGKFRLHVHVPGYLDMAIPTRTDGHENPIEMDIPLVPASSVTGHVRDGLGPAAAARVRATPIEDADAEPASSSHLARIAYSDRRGRFSLALVPHAKYRLAAFLDGATGNEVTIQTGAAGVTKSGVELSVSRKAAVSGEVRNMEGDPVFEAIVTLVSEENDLLAAQAGRRPTRSKSLSASSDSHGAFEITDVDGNDYHLVVVADGLEPLLTPGFHLAAAEHRDLGTLFLSTGIRITGRVEDSDGSPVEGASIRVALTDGRDRAFAYRRSEGTESDEDGRFQVTGLPPDQEVLLRIRHAGYLPKTATFRIPMDQDPVISLEPASRVVGYVVTENEAPVEGARVRLRPASSETPLLRRIAARGGVETTAVTDSEGRFEIPEAEAGPAILTAEAKHFETSHLAVDVPAGQTADEVEIILRKGRTLTGRVIDSSGSPVEDAVVSAEGKQSRSRGRGLFELSGLSPTGAVEIVARHPAFGSTSATASTSDPQPLVLRFQDSASLEIQVVDPGEIAVSGARITVIGGQTPFPRTEKTGASGRCQLQLEPGTYRVTVNDPRYRSAPAETVELEPGDHRELRVHVSPGIQVAGVIVGAESAQLAGASVRATSATETPRDSPVDTSGGYRLTGLRPGEWTITAFLRDGRRAEATVTLDGDRDLVRRDLEIGSGLELHGEVIVDGKPLAGGWVTVTSFDGAVLARTLTAHDGTFQVRGLQDERVQVDLVDTTGTLRLSVPARVDELLEVAVDTGTLSGTVYGSANGLPVEGAVVRLQPLADSRLFAHRGRTLPDGHFGPFRLPQGRYRLIVEHPGYRHLVTEVEIEPVGSDLMLGLDPAG